MTSPTARDQHAPIKGEPVRLSAEKLTVGYGDTTVLKGLDLTIEPGTFTALVGPNGCGKSTLLSALARLIPAREGAVLLDGALISKVPTRTVATRLGLLPQHPVAPDGITVAELVQRGRHPHHRWGSRTRDDDEIVADALERTHTAAFATRPVDSLSGGQRQRVWIAMALAQQTPLMLLDEPTSYLDMAHQIDILDLLTDLNRDGATIVAVLHDLNQAAAYSDTLVAMNDGAIVAAGRPRELVDEAFVEQVFGLRARVIRDPDTDAPLVLARSRRDLSSTGA